MAHVQVGLTPGSVFGGYRIEDFVARGGMGVIYKATQLALERTVALKLVAPELVGDQAFRERFKREAQLAASLDHPNILPVYEAGEIDGQLFLAMRYVIGTDLDTLIARQGALAPGRAVAIVAQIAGALDAAHGRGLVHRDVKPGNILIATEYGEERAYLTDFGLTKSAATGAHLTRTGYVVGTLDYVAPEQVQGGVVDGRADTYALACVLYHAVTGKIPFDKPGDVAKMYAHLNDPPPSAARQSRSVSAELDEVIRRGMAKRPDDRYASSGDLGRAARAAVAPGDGGAVATAPTEVGAPIPEAVARPDAPVAPAAPSPGRRGFEFGSRNLIIAAVVVVLIIIVAVVAIVAGGGGSSTTVTTTTTSTLPTTSTNPLSTSTTTTTTPAVSAYHAGVVTIIPRMNAVFARFPKGRDFGTPVFSRTSLSVAAGLRGIADNLDALTPPNNVLVFHEALVNDLHEMEQAFRSLASDSDNRDFNGAQTDLNKSQRALAGVKANVRRVENAP